MDHVSTVQYASRTQQMPAAFQRLPRVLYAEAAQYSPDEQIISVYIHSKYNAQNAGLP